MKKREKESTRDRFVTRYSIGEGDEYIAVEPPPERAIRTWAVVYGAVGALACVLSLAEATSHDPVRFLIYLACANLAAFGFRLTSSQSVLPAGFLFLLLGIEDLSLPELLFIGLSITLLREVRFVRRPRDIAKLIYAIASIAIGVASAQTTYRVASQFADNAIIPLPIITAAFVLMFNFGLSTTLLTRPSEAWSRTYRQECRPLLPWFIATAYLAYLIQCAALRTSYHPALIALPILFTLDRGYKTWTDSVAARKEEFARLHRNTLETLALAIDARDQTTHMHLRRVQLYALAVGRELKLSDAELEALNIAALLHDIGKLGIPDHILLKPGSLTPQEWEKMKTHAEIGAEMLSRMRFPELVSSIVRTHHEKWDGTGYPRGLKAAEIPVGSRILSAVDCLDALASDRPYRAALSLEDAMGMVRAQSGKSYDPTIVEILERRYVELEQMARGRVGHPKAGSQAAAQESIANLRSRLLVESKAKPKDDIMDPIVSARQETQLLQGLASDLAHSARLEEVVRAIHKCLSQMIQFDTLGIYVRKDDELHPTYFLGGNEALFTMEPFPIAKGLSGWVAQEGRPVLNGNVSLEPCYSNHSMVLNGLQAALSVVFESRGGTTGVITLYHLDRNPFTRDDLRILEAASVQIGPAIEGALKFKDAEESAVTDHLTGVPNGRALAAHLGRELQRAAREESTIGVLVCDLDGFKQVNDRFGHLKGNEVLQFVARGLRDACRGSDYLARMGGDEFVIVLPGLREDDPYHLERLQEVAARASEVVCGERCLSMSVGVAIYPFDGREAENLLTVADQRMYQIKYQSKSKYDSGTAIVADAPSAPVVRLEGLVRALADTHDSPELDNQELPRG